MGPKFRLANVEHLSENQTSIENSVMSYINSQFDRTMNWKHAEYAAEKWNGPFALKGVMSVADAKRAIAKRNTVNASRWEFYANQEDANVLIARIPRKKYRDGWKMMTSLMNLRT